MNNNLTELVFILDRSGSMSGLEKDTIGGYNSLIDKQQKEEGDCIVSTVLFDHEISVVCDREPLEKVNKMTEEVYFTRGMTALLDAIGGAIKHIGKLHKEMKNERPAKTLFVITTDGMENASCKYTYDKIKQMIEKKKSKHNWEFLFLGANIDAIDVAGKMGISADRAVNYNCDSKGTALNYATVSKAVKCFRMAAPEECAEALKNWDEDIAEDYEKRCNA